VVCPYGRFQSVLLDANSLAVVYDQKRGEPRGKKSAKGVGDCVDCKKCLNVCPTGADIRKGIQMECTQCMACIDACDSIMDKLGRDRGLIRLGSQNTIEGKPTRLVRPRVIAYALGFLGVLVLFTLVVSKRQPVELGVTRQMGAPYVTLPDGKIQNPMRMRISNKSKETRSFTLEVVDPPELKLIVPVTPFEVDGGKVAHMPFFAVLETKDIHGTKEPFTVRVTDDEGFSEDVKAEFMSGGLPQ
jgi:cytochrome c oxidase accessory protein FixG